MNLIDKYQDIDYFDIGNEEEIVVNSSILQYIDPTQNGHPKKFKEAILGNEEKKNSKSLELGGLFHLWLENPAGFIVADIDKPTESKAAVIEEFYKQWLLNDENLLELEMPNDNDTKSSYNGLTTIITKEIDNSVDDYKRIVAAARTARSITNYNGNLKEATFVNHLVECIDYFNFLRSATNKIILTRDIKEKLDNCKSSILNNSLAKDLMLNKESADENSFILTEQSIVFDHFLGIKCKAKLDKIILNKVTKTITIVDAKTYGLGSVLNEFIPLRKNIGKKTAFEYYRIYRQLAMYSEAVKHLGDCSDYKIICMLVVVETTFPYTSAVFAVNNTWLTRGKLELEASLGRIIEHIETQNWETPIELLSNEPLEIMPYVSG
jgi:hypothetical protein